MSSRPNPNSDPTQTLTYQIRLKGHLTDEWSDWFGGLTINLENNGDTLLTTREIDQAALHGLLRRVRDLGMPLLSVNSAEHRETDALDAKQ